MELITRGLPSIYEVESLARMLFPNLRRGEAQSTNCVIAELEQLPAGARLTATVVLEGDVFSETETCSQDAEQCMHRLCMLLYRAAVKATGKPLRWGMLTGIRPVKLFHEQLEAGKEDRQIIAHMQDRWAISEEMAQLSLSIAHRERMVNQMLREDGFSLYVSIPFCPARCSYCSFVSQSVAKDRSLLPAYTDLLCKELELVAQTAKRFSLKLQTVYIGGGTPTVLDEGQLAQLLGCISENFDFSNLLEYTVEAGRPDTITEQKLRLLKQYGVGRVSINPQTMNDDILQSVGRNHTAKEVENAYYLARKIGLNCINMDLIAGLPGETRESFARSVKRLITLDPENITVHSLTVKRASDMGQNVTEALFLREAQVCSMVDDARELLVAAGYYPYYLYRQKGTVGNLDNTGYCKPGQDCIYNVLMMDETQVVLTAGAGAVTKLRAKDGNISRIFAHKLPYEYIKDYGRIELQQQKVVSFYETGHSDQEPAH